MLNLNKPTSVEAPEAAIVGAATDEQLLEKLFRLGWAGFLGDLGEAVRLA